MKSSRLKILFNHRTMYVASLIGIMAIPSQAQYEVVSESSLPSRAKQVASISPPAPVVQNVSQATSQAANAAYVTDESYVIYFSKNSPHLDDDMKRTIDLLVPSMDHKVVTIVGRPDAIVTPITAKIRAWAIKSYLLSRGIRDTNIVTRVDNSPNPQQDGSHYPCYLYIGASNAPAIVADSPALPVSYAGLPITPIVPPATTMSNVNIQLVREGLMKLVANALAQGQVDNSMGMRMMTFLTFEPKTESAKPVPAPVPVIEDVAIIKRGWDLDKSKTLRGNVDAWVKIVGWKPLVWNATNQFQVTSNLTLQGNFYDVLKLVSDSSGVNLCVKKIDQIIKVTDSNVSCKG